MLKAVASDQFGLWKYFVEYYKHNGTCGNCWKQKVTEQIKGVNSVIVWQSRAAWRVNVSMSLVKSKPRDEQTLPFQRRIVLPKEHWAKVSLFA